VAIVDRGRLIALDTPRALVASLGAEHVVEFALADAQRGLSMDELNALAGVLDVRREGDGWALGTSEVHLAVPALIAALNARGAVLTALATHSATLEDVFVSLTGRHLRDQ
jgi:ABC-2 type transport system ATP-binding protein